MDWERSAVIVVALAWAFWFLPNAIETAVYRALLKFEALKQGEAPREDLVDFSFRLRGAAQEKNLRRARQQPQRNDRT